MEVEIRAQGLVLRARLFPKRAPRTVEAITQVLPIRSVAHRWGQEVYFAVPVEVEAEDPVQLVAMGDVAYWPAGRALCLFFGPTPSSRHPGEIRPASAVTVVGKILDHPTALDAIGDGTKIEVLKAS